MRCIITFIILKTHLHLVALSKVFLLSTSSAVHPSCRERLPPPVLEPVYTAASESSRDYQSIQCGSDTPYTAHSEC